MSESTDPETASESDYKEVMLGPKPVRVPVSWSVEKFASSKITNKIKAGGTPKSTNEKYYGGDIKYVKIEDMSAAGKYIQTTENHLTKEGLDSTSTWLVPEDSLLLSMYGSYGKVAITCDEMATNQAILGIIPSNSIDLDYFYYASSRLKPYFESVVLETTQANLNKGIVENTPILFPPLAEQRRIADILSTVDEQIQQTDDIIENTQQLKQGLMQDLFTQGLNNKESIKTRLGAKIRKIPQHWEVASLSEISDIKRGASPRPIGDDKYFGGDVGWIRISDITQTESKYVSEPSDYLSELGVSESVLIEPETLVLSISATIGKPAILQTEGCIHDGIVALRNLQKNVDIEYIYYALQDLQPRIQAQNQRAAGHQTNVNSKVVRQSEIPLPPLKEQKKIAEILGAADMKLEDEKDQLNTLKSLKRGLMQDLLTGKVRMPKDMID